MAILEDFRCLYSAVAVNHGASRLRGANVGNQIHAAILTRNGGRCGLTRNHRRGWLASERAAGVSI